MPTSPWSRRKLPERGELTGQENLMSDNSLIGRTIVAVRQMTDEERDAEHWHDIRETPVVLELDDGTILFPSEDYEGNGAGVLFGRDDDEAFFVNP